MASQEMTTTPTMMTISDALKLREQVVIKGLDADGKPLTTPSALNNAIQPLLEMGVLSEEDNARLNALRAKLLDAREAAKQRHPAGRKLTLVAS